MIRPVARPIARAIALDLYAHSQYGGGAGPVFVDLAAESLPPFIQYTSDGKKTYTGQDGLLHTAAANDWALEYDAVNYLRRNEMLYSEDLTRNYHLINGTATYNTSLCADGVTPMSQYKTSGSNGGIQQTLPTTISGKKIRVSMEVRNDTNFPLIRISGFGAGSQGVVFNTLNGNFQNNGGWGDMAVEFLDATHLRISASCTPSSITTLTLTPATNMAGNTSTGANATIEVSKIMVEVTTDIAERPYLKSMAQRGKICPPLGRSIWKEYNQYAGCTDDLTNAVWVKTGCTVAKDRPDLFGTDNSASSMVATAANATVLQTLTLGAAMRVYSVWLKAINVTGVINITMDGGTTWVPVTLTDEYTMFYTSQNIANPVIGVQIVNSGDSIAIAGVNLQGGAADGATTVPGPYLPNPNPTGTITRVGDYAGVNDLSKLGFNPLEGTMVIKATMPLEVPLTSACLFDFSNGTGGYTISCWMNSSSQIQTFDAVNSTIYANMTSNVGAGNTVVCGYSWKQDHFVAAKNGTITWEDVSGNLPTVDRLAVGSRSGLAGRELSGMLMWFRYYPKQIANADLQTATAN